jgi:hypothetical protein
MSMQSEGKDVKERNDQQATRDDTGSAGSGAMGGPAADQGNQQSGQQSSQQGAMPPSQTDDDQYDQGTARRER